MDRSPSPIVPHHDVAARPDGLRVALSGNHVRSSSSLREFRRSWGARDAGAALELFLKLRREIVSHLVWEEFALLEPFRDRLPQALQMRAVTEELVTHRALRLLLASVAGLLSRRGDVDAAMDCRIAVLLQDLQRQVDLHGSNDHDRLCSALAGVLCEAVREDLAGILKARDLRGPR